MKPDTEARVLRLLELIPRQQKQLMDALTLVQAEVQQLKHARELQETHCRLTHQRVNEMVEGVATRVERYEEQELTTGQHEIIKLENVITELRKEKAAKEHDEKAERRKWLFFAVSLVLSFLSGLLLRKV